ncbi:wall-associated receptor kinase-like 9 [Bidens hawaiensis]|uniref:wall-associated receptor kinase-like 9 n=1 Tax=Bidens hawaiensis TaxID=980011 RepID=UPI00404ADA8C
MKSPQTFILIIFISLTTATTELVPRYSKPGCIEKCGNMTIPYPFGIGPNCFLNKWYAVDCNSSKPYLSALKNLSLLGVDLNEQMVLVNVSMSSDCQVPVWNISQIVNLVGSPFLFSKMHNKFNVLGCGTAAISSQYGNELAECSTFCSQRPVGSRIGNCYGMNCCRVKVPYYLDTYSVSVTGNKSCVSAFLVAENLYCHELFSRQSFDGDVSSIPTVLRWMLPRSYYSEASCSYNFSRHELPMSNNTSVHTGKCSCLSELEEGNPYLSGGCKVNEECTKCQEARGFCMYKVSYGGLRNFTCDYKFGHRRSKSSSRAIFLGVGIIILILVLNALAFTLYKIIQRAKDKRRKRRFFERNGGLLLKQQEAGNDGLVEKTKLFTSNELERATDYFSENRIIGRGGQGTVYKGMLSDGRIIAVKKSKVINQRQLEQFINEMVILSQVNHRNVVKLLGCCLETDVPILVSEFISNGTLYDHIHQENTHVFISWNMRLQIATQVAGALSYLHSATSIPIYHRDIKSTNILLDEKYNAKISDFGTSRFISMGQTHLTTVVKGTLGYLDPEYFQSSQFTGKSDVYSFGVVLLELLTGEKPICIRRFGGSISLVSHFMISFEEGQVMSLLDAKMVREGGMDVLLKVANLATRCLNLCGKNRPTMKEVALELETIRMSHFSPVQTDFGKVKYNGGKEEEILMLSYGVSTSSSIT